MTHNNDYITKIIRREVLHRKDDEHFSAHVTVAVSPQFFGWLTGLGRGIKIRYPEDVKEQYRAYLQGIVDDL